MDACVTKGGLSCVMGGIHLGHSLGVSAMDHLLDLFLSNDKYSQVVVLSLDRSIPEIFEGAPKLVEMTDTRALQAHLDASKSKSSTAVLVYSGSALTETAVDFPHGLAALDSLLVGMSALLASVTLFHATLHSRQQQAKLRCLFANTVDVTPNPGAVSSDCFALCRTIRTARSSAKRATESEEFLVRREVTAAGDQALYHFAVLSPTRGRGVGDTAKKVATGVAAPHANKEEGKEKEKSEDLTFSSTEDGGPQLVVFDKTDPEWDEDSDPDGDLDL